MKSALKAHMRRLPNAIALGLTLFVGACRPAAPPQEKPTRSGAPAVADHAVSQQAAHRPQGTAAPAPAIDTVTASEKPSSAEPQRHLPADTDKEALPLKGDAQAAREGPTEAATSAADDEKAAAPAARQGATAQQNHEERLLQNLAPVNPDKPDGPVDPDDPYISAQELERRLGPPLVDDAEKLVRLDPVYPLWIDRPPRKVVMVGAVCGRQVPLELFACLKGSKEHEAVVVVYTKASLVHAALLATGVEPGRPVRFQPDYAPAAGPEIEVTVIWKDPQGQRRRARAQQWVRDANTKQAMQHPWVFAGSEFRLNEFTKQREYWADGDGSLICVSNFPSALLDVPVRSSDANAELAFEAFTEHIPPRGTPVTLVLEPKPASAPGEPRGK